MHRFSLFVSILILVVGCDTAYDPTSMDDAAVLDDAAPDPDAASGPDAWSDPSCPGYASDVQPLYQQHCASCHTTGPDTRFGSSITTARRSSSACGTPMAACTIQLGRVGGQMAWNDPYGGFTSAEVAMIQSWVACGMPN